MADDTGDDFWILLEGGGSQTRLACATSRAVLTRQIGSTSPRSVTPAESQAALARLARDACRAAKGDPARCGAVVAAHGAASTSSTCESFFDSVKVALRQAGIECPLLVTNDLVPLLLGSAERVPLVVVVAGTGTGFGARSPAGRWARASGCEYLLSDEGGGFDIGMSGLRAAVRARDGRGSPTALLERARQWCGSETGDVIDRLCEKVYVPGFKPTVASFAPHVLEAAPYDEMARAIVASSARELAAGARAVMRSAGCDGPGTRVLLAGSLLTKHEILASGLREKLAGHTGITDVGVVPDGWLLAGFSELRKTWRSGGDALQRLAAVFPVKSDVP